MQCPEIWNFNPPKHYLNVVEFGSDDNVLDCINMHYFNHSVSVVFPNSSSFLEKFDKEIIEDSTYYKIENVHVLDLVDKEFIEAFVKKGELTLLSIENKIDVNDVIAITPAGLLILNLLRSTYQKLGIEGKPSFFDRKNYSRYVVAIDLKDQKFTPGKRCYERIKNSLVEMEYFKFNVVLSWDPNDEKICPSSIAAWFEKRVRTNHFMKFCSPVKTCRVQTNQRAETNVTVPIVEHISKSFDFFEWIGFFSFGAKMVNETTEEKYANSYATPSPYLDVEKVYYRQYYGLFTRGKIDKIYNFLKKCSIENDSESLQWYSIDVQGFSDCPVNWGLKEHTFYTDGDNSYTIARCPGMNKPILRKNSSANNKPRIS